MTTRDVALAKAKFCERWAKTDPARAAAHKQVAAAWWRIFYATEGTAS